ncbi:MAG: hypothetical protein M1469_07170 [Bacteroidetes bacterium]|nr:hypothetical protein [Bacteroidota bacterium]
MENKDLYNSLFHLSSLLTDLFPRRGASALDLSLTSTLGSDLMVRSKFKKDVKRLSKAERTRRILVFSDLNIGDALFSQASVTALRDFFPSAEIDLVISAAARSLIEGNPEVSRLMPEFHGAPFPDQGDFDSVRRISASRTYDIIFTFSPFFQLKNHFPKHESIIDFTTLASMLVQGERLKNGKNHVVYQTHRFVHGLFLRFMEPVQNVPFRGVSVTLSDEAIGFAEQFLRKNEILDEGPMVFLNPDASTRFTGIPAAVQVDLLKKLTRSTSRVLLGGGHSNPGIENHLLTSLSHSERSRITVVPPSLPIDAYAALIDFTQVYISGDAGPLHIAAARKRSRSGYYEFRNRTSVFSIFGATPSRIYGYDSRYSNSFAANQDSPSHIYISQSPCRNITCINKMAKTCKTLRCFEFVDVERIAEDAAAIIGRIGSERAVPVLSVNHQSV